MTNEGQVGYDDSCKFNKSKVGRDWIPSAAQHGLCMRTSTWHPQSPIPKPCFATMTADGGRLCPVLHAAVPAEPSAH